MDTLEFRVVSVDDARAELEATRRQTAQLAHGPAETRPEGDRILDATIRWLARLPEDARPIELARQFPRIANALAQLWPRAERCAEYLDSLAIDDRGGCRGFPAAVAAELTRLRSHYAGLHAAGAARPHATLHR